MAMVKGDAYGHGMVETAAVLADCGCRTFGVAELVEAVALRGAGIGGDIFVILGFVPEEAEQFLLHDLTPVVFLDQDIRALSQAAVRHGREIGVHLKLDCGMGRLGLLPAEVPAFKQRIDALPGIFLAGVMAHLPEADQRQAASTPQIFSCFQETIARIWRRFHRYPPYRQFRGDHVFSGYALRDGAGRHLALRLLSGRERRRRHRRRLQAAAGDVVSPPGSPRSGTCRPAAASATAIPISPPGRPGSPSCRLATRTAICVICPTRARCWFTAGGHRSGAGSA